MSSSKVAIYTALFANLAIAGTKFVAAAITGSSAMVSEGIHSLVDTSNEILLLYGMKKSKKKADLNRPFGYAKELYFWSFIVSILIFSIGGGLSFYEGITHLQHPTAIKDPLWNYIVLGFAIIFDGISFITAQKAFNEERGKTPFWEAVRHSKDPATFIVLFEDAADVVGLVVAFLGVFLGHYFNNPYFDGIASILIGCILTAISVTLTRESRSLLMGESAEEHIIQSVIKICKSDKAVSKVLPPLSMYLGPQDILMVLPIVFEKGLTTVEINEGVVRLKHEIKNNYQQIHQIFIEPQQMQLELL